MELTQALWDAARADFEAWLSARERDERIVILHDSDADGVSAAVVARRALAASGFTNLVLIAPNRERDAWTESNRAAVRAAAPTALLVLDLGSRSQPIAAAPHCLIDHHRPEGVPDDGVLISGYSWEPAPNTSLIVRECVDSLHSSGVLDWIASLGILSDLGDQAPFPILKRVRDEWPITTLREITSLVNAARRGSTHQPEVAVRLVESSDDPSELVRSESEELRILRDARAEVKGEMDNARKAAPLFSGNVALVRVSSPCQVHPVIAQIWRTRLPKYVVIVSNDGYLPGRVNFSMRTASEVNLLDMLGGIDLGREEGSYGRGHDKATGGSVTREQWRRLLLQLGFDEEIASS